jgi:AcrR family transcriptional regulator
MSQERFREAIVRAAMPLIGEYDALTTARIAQAAGVGEADLLAVFDDKDAVVRACMATVQAELRAALDPGEALQQLDTVSVDQALPARLVAVINTMDAYYDRARAGFGAIQQSARPAGEPTPSFGREDFRAIGRLPETRRSVARLLEPDQERLRHPADVLAEAFLGMSLSPARTLPAEQLVDLFLHGALATG